MLKFPTPLPAVCCKVKSDKYPSGADGLACIVSCVWNPLSFNGHSSQMCMGGLWVQNKMLHCSSCVRVQDEKKQPILKAKNSGILISCDAFSENESRKYNSSNNYVINTTTTCSYLSSLHHKTLASSQDSILRTFSRPVYVPRKEYKDALFIFGFTISHAVSPWRASQLQTSSSMQLTVERTTRKAHWIEVHKSMMSTLWKRAGLGINEQLLSYLTQRLPQKNQPTTMAEMTMLSSR